MHSCPTTEERWVKTTMVSISSALTGVALSPERPVSPSQGGDSPSEERAPEMWGIWGVSGTLDGFGSCCHLRMKRLITLEKFNVCTLTSQPSTTEFLSGLGWKDPQSHLPCAGTPLTVPGAPSPAQGCPSPQGAFGADWAGEE